jgi:competence ComEA-like helix-hairpin-helix protein
MSDPETRALGRAAVLLLVASLARWGWEATGVRGTPPPQTISTELLERSRSAAGDEEARSRPLAPDERMNPNSATEEALDRLPGIGAATARAIVRSRQEDGPFQGPEDLTRVKGVGPAALARMVPHLAFKQVAVPRAARSSRPVPRRGVVAGAPPLDLNRASATDLEALPGIGPALARRIVDTRSRKPFSSVDELERVPGIGPATVARLRPLVVARP